MSAPWRWRLADRLRGADRSEAHLVIIGGCGSSGTTLLRHRLDRHPKIFCGPESTLFLERITSAQELAERFGFAPAEVRRWQAASPTRLAFIERFQRACLEASGKAVWAEKTPENIRQFEALADRFPNARFVHLVRDGRDVACSLRRARWMKLEKITGGADRASPEALAACARYWAERVRAGRRLAGSPRYHEVRYEELVLRPEPTLRALLGFLGVEWDEAVLRHQAEAAAPAAGPVSPRSMGRWRSELSPEALAVFEREAGAELAALGYAAAPAGAAPERAAAAIAHPAAVGARRAPWKALRRDLYALWLAMKHPRVPRLARMVTILAALYLLAPFDLIPDRIPVFGYLDDAMALAAAGALVLRIVPAALRRELRYAAAMRLSRRIWAA